LHATKQRQTQGKDQSKEEMKYRIKETNVIVESVDGSDSYYWTMKGNKRIFAVSGITLEELYLTLEEIKPEVKKLYAYKSSLGNINFHQEQNRSESDYPCWDRAPEYDILYPKEGDV